MPQTRKILVYGGPDGFHYTGPVDDVANIESTHIDARCSDLPWWVADLEPFDADGDPDVLDVARNTDWTLFADQKAMLVEVINDPDVHNRILLPPAGENTALDGLLTWIDEIQDALARELGEDFIFPRLKETP